jgi:cytidylate kinase
MTSASQIQYAAFSHWNKKQKRNARKMDKVKTKVITIDGPAGSGKSTVASAVASFLSWTYVTTGAIYRTLGYLLHEHDVHDLASLRVDECVQVLVESYRQDSKTGRVYLGEIEITDRIRTPEASERASLVAQNGRVRKLLLPVQRKVVTSCDGAVVDGRDMGTVVFPEAPLKVFLTAAPEERARRRAEELRAKGQEVNMEALVKEIHERDERDSNRAEAPMRPAADAVHIDCTKLSATEVASVILKHALERGLVDTQGFPV